MSSRLSPATVDLSSVSASGRRAERGSSSLDLNRESVPGLAPEICPKKPYWLTAKDDPKLRFPASCDAYLCTVCGPRKAEQKAALMTHALRHLPPGSRGRLVTLTQAPGDWQARRKKVRVLALRLRERGYVLEWAWATERNPKGTGVHVHLVEHGPHKVPQDLLQDLWGRIVDIRAIRRPAAGRYAVKEALSVCGYAVKGATARGNLDGHLAINGGRAVHMSRGFLHGHTAREALAQLRRELAGGTEHEWVLLPAWTS